MRRSLVSIFLFLLVFSVSAQTMIDAPVATVRLTRQEVVSQRTLKNDFERLEAVANRKLTPDERRQVLDTRINNILFFQYCEREKIIAAESEIAAYLGNARAQMGQGAKDEDLEKLLRAQGVIMDIKTWAQQQILLQKYIQTKQADRLKSITPPTADDIIKEYEFNKKNYFLPEMVRVSMIYVDLKNKGPEDRKKGLDTINGVSAQIKASPDKFGEFTTRALSGEMPYKASAQFAIPKTAEAVKAFGQKFTDVAFATKPGQISEPIESAGANLVAYAVIRVEEHTTERFLGLSDLIPGQNRTVSQFIQAKLGMERAQTVLSQIEHELLTQLRSEATIKINDEKLEF